MNKKGVVELWFMLFVVFFVVGGSIVFTAHNERVAIADDVKSGKLELTPKADALLTKGDTLLDKAGSMASYEQGLFTAFVAKVYYERARLDMEIN